MSHQGDQLAVSRAFVQTRDVAHVRCVSPRRPSVRRAGKVEIGSQHQASTADCRSGSHWLRDGLGLED